MSISQIKRRFEQFETYLGRDAQGLGKLKALKDAVNELRTSLAQLETKATEHAATADRLAQRCRVLSNEKESADIEIHRLRQVVSNLERELRSAWSSTRSDDTLDATNDSTDSSVGTEREIKLIVKKLRRRSLVCPKATRVSREMDRFDGFARAWNRESIAEGWSGDAIWTLGASVAVLVAMAGVVVIETDLLVDSMTRFHDPNSDESCSRQFFQWFRKNIDDTPQKQSGFVRVENSKSTFVPTLHGLTEVYQ